MIPAAPSAPIKNTVSAWNGQFALLEQDLRRWTKRMEAGKPPLTNTERIQLQSILAATTSMVGAGPAAELAAGAAIHADAAAAKSLKTTLDALPAHVTATVKEVSDTLGWAKYGNPQAVAAVVNGGIGQMTADWKNLSESQRVVITQVVAQNVARGKGPRETGRMLSKALGKEFAGGQARSVMISRTTMAAAYDQASALTYAEAHKQGLITGWEWIASPGACPVCYELHGNVFPAEQPPYRHPNCRCATAPVTVDMPKAKKQFYTGKNDVELVTGKSGWTTWTKVPSKPSKSAVDDLLGGIDEIQKAKKATPDLNPQTAWPDMVPTQVKTGDWGINTPKYMIQQFNDGSFGAKSKDGSWSGVWESFTSWKTIKGGKDAKVDGSELLSGLAELSKASGKKPKPSGAGSANQVKEAVKVKEAKKAKQGTVESPKGLVEVVAKKDGSVKGQYDGVEFDWSVSQQHWIHVPSGTTAGPNSNKFLMKAVSAGDIELPEPPLPKGRIAREKERDTEADIKAGKAFQANHPDASPIKGVSAQEWRQNWNDVSDGYDLKNEVKFASGWKTMWSRIRSYTGSYKKAWTAKTDKGALTMDAKSRKLFETAPAYSQPAWRGLDLNKPSAPFTIDEFVENFPVGSTLDMRGGSSFSFSKDTAQGFGRKGEGGVLIHINQGFTGIPVRGFSGYGHENEVLVASKLRVVDRYQTRDGNWHYIVEQEGRLYQ
jgi:SPP1 gp7 family putative phage head morphogenesis protein